MGEEDEWSKGRGWEDVIYRDKEEEEESKYEFEGSGGYSYSTTQNVLWDRCRCLECAFVIPWRVKDMFVCLDEMMGLCLLP